MYFKFQMAAKMAAKYTTAYCLISRRTYKGKKYVETDFVGQGFHLNVFQGDY